VVSSLVAGNMVAAFKCYWILQLSFCVKSI
jgi:hypothetical protein